MTTAPGLRVPLMRTSILTFDVRSRQRFHTLAYHVAYHARPGEKAQVDRLVRLVEAGHVNVRDAHLSLVALRRDQQAAA